MIPALVALTVLSAFTRADDFVASVNSLGDAPKLIYRLTRHEAPEGDVVKSESAYTTPEGKVVLTESMELQGGKLRKYSLQHLLSHEGGSIEVKGDRIFFSYTKDGKTKTDDEKLQGNLIVPPITSDLIKNNWDTILKGDDVNARFAAVDRQETVGFKFFKDSESKIDGREVIKVKMKPTSFIIAAIVNPMIFTFDKATRKLLTFRGRILPKLQDGDQWKDQDGEIVYPP